MIQFWKGTSAEYNTLKSNNKLGADWLYFCTDGKIYLGTNANPIADYSAGDIGSINSALQAINTLISGLQEEDGKIRQELQDEIARIEEWAQRQLNTKAPIASPALTGTPTAPTAAETTNTTQIATTAFVQTVAGNKASAAQTAAISAAAADATSKANAAQAAAIEAAASDATTKANAAQAAAIQAAASDAASKYATIKAASDAQSKANDAYTLASGKTTLTEVDNVYAKKASPTFTGTPAAPTATKGTNTTQIATTAFVQTAVTEAKTALEGTISSAMVFKGTAGTGGTVTTTTFPTAAATLQGDTYKVITAGTYGGITAKVGDVLVCDGSKWVLIPSGDEPNGTVTNIATGTGLTGGPITSTGTISLANTAVTAGAYGNTSQQTPSHGGTFNIPYFTVDQQGRLTAAGSTTVQLPADNNTTYGFTGALSSDNATFVATLTAGGTGTTATVPAMTGASSSAAGKGGLVPVPAKGAQSKFLRGDGTWQSVSLSGALAAGNDAKVMSGFSVSGRTITGTQKTLTAGDNVTITGGTDSITIAATDTKYTGNNGISISNSNVITNAGVRSISTGTAAGTISVNTNGTAADVTVNGWANVVERLAATEAALTWKTGTNV